MTSESADIDQLSYEQARDELVAVVGKLESGAASLEESLALWERGEALADRCQGWLDAARQKLATAKADSTVTASAEADPNHTNAQADQASPEKDGNPQ